MSLCSEYHKLHRVPKNGYKARGRGALGKEKPPIFGMIQRSGEVFIQMLPNVKQITIKPINESVIIRGIKVYTDEYRYLL